MEYRKLADDEKRLLWFLVVRAGLNFDAQKWIDNAIAQPMDDGNMGSLKLALPNSVGTSRSTGRVAAEARFVDADGTEVLVTLYLDVEGAPFELDIWKADFSPLIRIAESSDFR